MREQKETLELLSVFVWIISLWVAVAVAAPVGAGVHADPVSEVALVEDSEAHVVVGLLFVDLSLSADVLHLDHDAVDDANDDVAHVPQLLLALQHLLPVSMVLTFDPFLSKTTQSTVRMQTGAF